MAVKLISVLCLGKTKKCDYVRHLRAESIAAVDSACEHDREDRKDVNSTIVTTLGSIQSSEMANDIAERWQEALNSVT